MEIEKQKRNKNDWAYSIIFNSKRFCRNFAFTVQIIYQVILFLERVYIMERKAKIIIASRGSQLALWQANFIKVKVHSFFPDIYIEMRVIKTQGDKILNTSLSKIGDKGLFTKELETALINREIDLAVHSLKDLQTDIPEKLLLAAVTDRHDVRDVLIARMQTLTIETLPENAVVGTGSLRRRAQLLHLRPDLQIEDLRGNVNTRIIKLFETDWDAIVLASAGVERLGLSNYISSYIPVDLMVPAVGQGALGVEIHEENEFAQAICDTINHRPTNICVSAERSFLRALGGGCKTPIGAYCTIEDKELCLEGLVASVDGKKVIREKIKSLFANAEETGIALANRMLAQGADKILRRLV
jgi:hydroxymethylbilane synthase